MLEWRAVAFGPARRSREEKMAKAAVLHDWQGVAQNSAKLVAAPSARRGGFLKQEFVDEEDTAAKLADFDISVDARAHADGTAQLAAIWSGEIYALP